MIIDQYFPLEATITHDDNVYSLLDEMGAKGFGAYILMLMELRFRNNYECDETCLRSVARTARMRLKLVEDVVYNYNLFTIKTDNEAILISSVYLNRVMQKLEEKRKKLSEAGKKGAEKSGRSPDGRFTVLDGTAKHSIAKQSIATKKK